jgi:hypothetical protein
MQIQGLCSVIQTMSVNVLNLTPVEELLFGDENTDFAGAGYYGAKRRTKTNVAWYIPVRLGKQRALTDSTQGRIMVSPDELFFSHHSVVSALRNSGPLFRSIDCGSP